MNQALRKDADAIISASLAAVQPDEAVQRALRELPPRSGKTILIATGKAAWQMAYAAVKFLGHVDGTSLAALKNAGLDVFQILHNNDAYHGLQAIGGLIMTGPTGTNVNDVAVALLAE